MKTIKMICSVLMLFFFISCSNVRLFNKMKKDVLQAYTINGPKKEGFNKYRKQLLEHLTPSILENDTIIIFEYFTDGVTYSARIYESNTQNIHNFVVTGKIKKNKPEFNLIEDPNNKSISLHILKMIQNNELEEIRQRGNNTVIIPDSRLSICIIIPNKERSKMRFESIITKPFSPIDYKKNMEKEPVITLD